MRSKSKELMNQILAFSETYYFEHHSSPTTTEIAEHLLIARSTAYKYLVAMQKEGLISYNDGEIVTKKMQKLSFDHTSTPVVGSISCGLPALEEESIEEYVSLPVALFGKGDFFILRASGESMIDAGIHSGDLVVIRKQQTAKEGDIVVALVDHETTTLKRLQFDSVNRSVILHPENKDMEDQIYPADQTPVEIQGVAEYVIKKL